MLKLLLLCHHSAAGPGRGVVFEMFFVLNRLGFVRVDRGVRAFRKANAGTATILRDEEHACVLQTMLHILQDSFGRGKRPGLEIGYRLFDDFRGRRQVILRPSDESTRSAALDEENKRVSCWAGTGTIVRYSTFAFL
ncbi:hypothetical protein GGQ65_001950 [Rhizobium fabae]|uniref:Uncharacterized protein n=1 Tax=Rhizobium fabae TaxID=573179 RepID=A0A7W6B675_9HYPH|nr:hypothetical protein [Rhizobium fabae]